MVRTGVKLLLLWLVVVEAIEVTIRDSREKGKRERTGQRWLLFEWQRMGVDGLDGLDGCASLGLGWLAAGWAMSDER